MGDPTARIAQQVQLGRIDVHGVRHDRTRAKDAGISQPVYHALAMLIKRIVLIGFMLANVNVKARVQIARSRNAIGQCLVAQ